MAEATPGGGLLGSLRGLAASLVEITRTRLALLANELEEQGATFARIAIYAVIAAMAFFFAAMLGIAFVIALVPVENRALALGCLFALFLAAGVIFALMARSLFANRPKLCSATLAELEKDRAALTAVAPATSHADR